MYVRWITYYSKWWKHHIGLNPIDPIQCSCQNLSAICSKLADRLLLNQGLYFVGHELCLVPHKLSIWFHMAGYLNLPNGLDAQFFTNFGLYSAKWHFHDKTKIPLKFFVTLLSCLAYIINYLWLFNLTEKPFLSLRSQVSYRERLYFFVMYLF